MGKLTISMAIFNSYVSHYQRVFLFHIGEILFAWNGWKGSVWCSTPGWTLNLSWDWTSNFSCCFLGWSSQQDRTPNAELSCQRSQPSAKLCFAKDCEVLLDQESVSKGSPGKLVPIPHGASCKERFQCVQIYPNIITISYSEDIDITTILITISQISYISKYHYDIPNGDFFSPKSINYYGAHHNPQ